MQAWRSLDPRRPTGPALQGLLRSLRYPMCKSSRLLSAQSTLNVSAPKEPPIRRVISTRRVKGKDPPIRKVEGKAPIRKVEGRAPPELELQQDHRALASRFQYFISHPTSPGSPLFLPDGAHIFKKLEQLIKAHYPAFGFREVLTPNLFKESLWHQSGHWDNYKANMYRVHGGDSATSETVKLMDEAQNAAKEDYGLKPMNCPGHCLLFKSQKHSWRDLPIRYADFSPLHRNEISGALTGLTRVTRFHQDDGHIFCRLDQVQQEIEATLQFVKLIYQVLGLDTYHFALSTRPKAGFLGDIKDWEQAESQLEAALTQVGMHFEQNPGDGAFYGPKIDIIVKDKDGKDHQTATIQLDFQLPKRFELEYDGPVPSHGASSTGDDHILRPVMIHRAVLGSFERMMALLIEHTQGQFPFWLSPRQVVILPVTNEPHLLKWAEQVRHQLNGSHYKDASVRRPVPLGAMQFNVDIDSRGEPLSKRIRQAKMQRYNLVVVIGERDYQSRRVTVDASSQTDKKASSRILDEMRDPAGSQSVGNLQDLSMEPRELRLFIKKLTNRYL